MQVEMTAVELHSSRPGQGSGPTHFEDYAHGMLFRSPRIEVHDDDVRAYVRFSNDIRPIADRSSASGPPPVPQMFLFSLGVSALLHGDSGYIPREFVAFYGFDKITFHDNTVAGTTIQSTAVVIDLVERRSTGLVAYRHETSTESGRLLVSSEQKILVRRRTAGVSKHV